MTSTVGILGTGMMGEAFGKLYIDRGYDVTVWNRTPEKTENLLREGAAISLSADELIENSQIVFCTVTTYDTLQDILESSKGVISGKLLVNLVTGTADEARTMAALVEGAGGNYLDGAIEAYPSDIGEPNTLIVYGGSKALWDRYETLLHLAGGASRWVGADVGAANVFDTAMAGGLGTGCLAVFIESIHYANSAGLASSELEGSIDYFLTLAKREMLAVLQVQASKNFDGGGAPLSIYESALRTWHENMRSSGFSAPIMSAHLRAVEQAVVEGRGDLHIAATYAAP